jgi:hypothetical protein
VIFVKIDSMNLYLQFPHILTDLNEIRLRYSHNFIEKRRDKIHYIIKGVREVLSKVSSVFV